MLRGGTAAALPVRFDSRVRFTRGRGGCNCTAAWHKSTRSLWQCQGSPATPQHLLEPPSPVSRPRLEPYAKPRERHISPSHKSCAAPGPSTLAEEQTLHPGPQLLSPAGSAELRRAASAPRASTRAGGETPGAGRSHRRSPSRPARAAGAAICSPSERGRSQPCHLQPSLATLGSTSALPACSQPEAELRAAGRAAQAANGGCCRASHLVPTSVGLGRRSTGRAGAADPAVISVQKLPSFPHAQAAAALPPLPSPRWQLPRLCAQETARRILYPLPHSRSSPSSPPQACSHHGAANPELPGFRVPSFPFQCQRIPSQADAQPNSMSHLSKIKMGWEF